jgi:hypothetical protein
MNQELYNENQMKVEKVCKRILESKEYDYFRSVWKFDDELMIELYHGLYSVTFKGVTVGRFHSDDKVCPDYNLFYVSIYLAIQARKKQHEKTVLSGL